MKPFRALRMRKTSGGTPTPTPTPTPAASYRYVRVLYTANNGSQFGVSTGRLVIYSRDGSGNYIEVQASAGGSASSTGPDPTVAAAFSAWPIPGDSNNCWVSNARPTVGSPQWLKNDLGSAKEIIGFAIINRANNGFAPTQAPRDFKLQGSNDDSSWTDIIAVTDQIDWQARELRRWFVSGLASYTGSPWGAHRYVRWCGREDDTGVCQAEIRIRSTPTGSDLTPSSYTVSSTQGGTAAANLFDGNNGTIWSGSSSNKEDSVVMDMGSAINVAAAKSVGRTGFEAYSTDVIALQVGDSTSGPWTTVAYSNQMDLWASAEVRVHADPLYKYTATSGHHRFWRLYFSRGNGTNRVAIYEAQFKDSGGTNKCGSGLATSSNTDGSNLTARAFNGNLGDGWGTSNANGGDVAQWLQYDFLEPVEITSISINASGTDAPADFYVHYSDDGVNWTAAAAILDQTGWGTPETRSFTLSSYSTITQYRLWRFTYTGAPHSGNFTGVGEFRLLDGSDNPITLTNIGTRESGRYDNNWPSSEMFDGSTSSDNGWISPDQQYPHHYLHFRTSVSLAPVKLSATPVNNFANAFPTAYRVEKTKDGAVWELVKNVTTTTPSGGVAQLATI